ncbi:DUF2000 family protein [Nocardioides hankookensis]
MAFDTKIAVLLRDDLEMWQRLNATAFLVSGVTAAYPQLVGAGYADADGTPYVAMLGQPVLVFEGDAATLTAAHERALRPRWQRHDGAQGLGLHTLDHTRNGAHDGQPTVHLAVQD